MPLPVPRQRKQHEHVLRTIGLELVVLARLGPLDGVLACRALGDIDGVFGAHGGHGDEAAGLGADVRAEVDELVLQRYACLFFDSTTLYDLAMHYSQ